MYQTAIQQGHQHNPDLSNYRKVTIIPNVSIPIPRP